MQKVQKEERIFALEEAKTEVWIQLMSTFYF